MSWISLLEGLDEEGDDSMLGLGNPFKDLLSPSKIKEEVTAFAGGAGGGAVYDLLVGKVDWFGDANWKRLVAAGGLAVLGGNVLKKKSSVLAHGFVGGLGAKAEEVIMGMLGVNLGALSFGDDDDDMDAEAGMAQLPEEQELLGLDAATVASEAEVYRGRELAGNAFEVREDNSLGSFLGG